MGSRVMVDLFSTSSIDGAISVIRRIQSALNGAALETLVGELGRMGVEYAQVRYSAAQYDGVNDVTVSLIEGVASDVNASVTISAQGDAVLFIEFGTGIYYPDNADARAMITSGDVVGRGEYGKGKGNQTTWVYIDADSQKVFTHGNPSNACMYETRKILEERLASTAKEVFRW